MNNRKIFLCIACEFKGTDFIRALGEAGHGVFLVTSEQHRDKNWPSEYLEDIFFMPEQDGRKWNINDLIAGTAFLFRKNHIDKMIALDDYDVWKAAVLREEFRSPGMGQTTARHFFDKLAMRMVARENQILIPGFSPLFNDADIHKFLDASTGPWVVKPRTDAGALGIRKLYSQDDFWNWNEEHHDERYHFLIEEFKPGHVYHVDSIFQDYRPLFSRASQYLQPPFEVAHGGGVFRSHTLSQDHEENEILAKLNEDLLKAFGLRFGASHSEFIRNEDDGKFYFLETSARVGGAHLAEMVEAATGINLWREWAKLELAELQGTDYQAPVDTGNNAGIVVTLSRHERPDYGKFNDPDIVWTLQKEYHIGMILRAKERKTILNKLDRYTEKIFNEYHATVPLKE
jgi:biotin carboxylase